MLRICIKPNQKDWVNKLPAIEFAINAARSESTGYSPFFLNYGRMPRSMIFNTDSTYPGVRKFAAKIKDAIMSAHDAIIHSRVKQTDSANKHRIPAPFVEGELVYLSTQNMSIPRGRSRKLFPKYVGPYKIITDYGNNTYKLDLLSRTCHGSRGVFGEVIDQRPVIGQAKCHASREDRYLRPEQL